MKRSSLLTHLRRHGCYLKREGRAHSLWTNPRTGAVEAVPRHVEISNNPHERSAAAFQCQIQAANRALSCPQSTATLCKRRSARSCASLRTIGFMRKTVSGLSGICLAVPSTFAPVDNIPVTPDYVIGPGDEIQIRALSRLQHRQQPADQTDGVHRSVGKRSW